MSTIKDGGPAFPMQDQQAIHAWAQARIEILGFETTAERDAAYIQARAEAIGGMSLRDYFAIHANIGDVDELAQSWGEKLLGRANPGSSKPVACLQWWADYRAKLRYMEADAMLRARGQS